jgi:tripartite-type tricarboxylate transporter receptor subunit TctC
MQFASRLPALLGLAALAFSALPQAAYADYPDHPIKMVVPFPPGGGADLTARVYAEAMSKKLGQPIIVENKGGAGGAIGAAQVANSEGDGYTILYTTPGQQITLPYLMKTLPYDPKSLKPVSQVSLAPSVLVINKNVPVKNVAELIALAKKKPGELTCGSSGIGASSHLNCELLQSMAGIKLQHVPYKGTSETLKDLVGGELTLTIDTIGVYASQIEVGNLVALGVTTPQRIDLLPKVPPIADTLPGFDASPVNYLTVPAKTPDRIVDLLSKATIAVSKEPEVRDRLHKLSILEQANSPAEMAELVRAEQVKWKKVIDNAGIKPQ